MSKTKSAYNYNMRKTYCCRIQNRENVNMLIESFIK